MTRLDRTLDTVGEGAGSKDAAVDGSVTPVFFKIVPPSSNYRYVHRMIVEVRDNGVFEADRYGSIIGGLTNGIQVGRFANADDSLVKDFTDGLPIKTNADWGRACYDVDLKTWGSGDSFLTVRWTFSKAGGPIRMIPGQDWYFGVKIQDDCSTLVSQYFTVQGDDRA